jgi:hypothetical protein
MAAPSQAAPALPQAAPAPSQAASPPALTPLDVASGMLVGLDPHTPPLPDDGAPGGVRAAVEEVLAQALQRPPCVVSFSGGRDSSPLMALATAVARQRGLQPPVAVTLRFPGMESAEEDAWQEGLLGHIGVKDWVRVDVTDEFDAVGPVALAGLRRHGLLYPFNTHFMVPVMGAARGGTVVTGMGGDELFTPLEWARLASVRYGGARPGTKDLLRAALAFSPAPARRAVVGRRLDLHVPWLRPPAMRQLRRQMADWIASQPVRFDRAIREWWWRSRYLQAGRRSLATLGADHDTVMVHPYAEPEVLRAAARQQGAAGWRDRTSAVEALFGDVLPAEVVRRPTKATFDDALFNRHFRELVAGWDGAGLDGSLVEVAALRRVWATTPPDCRTVLLLQTVWLQRAEQEGKGKPAL